VDNVGRWTNEEIDAGGISNGLLELSKIMIAAQNNGDAEKAMDWYLRIVYKIEDWPANKAFPSDIGQRWTTKDLVDKAFDIARFEAFDHSIAEVLLDRLRPDDKHAEWLSDWDQSAALLKRERER
jgi:hypothetical protein